MEKRQRKRVSEFISVRDEEVKILVSSCYRKMYIIGMRRSRKPCAAKPQEGWRHAVIKLEKQEDHQ